MKRRRKSLVDLLAKNMAKKDTKNPPAVNLARWLYPIKHSSQN